LPSLFVFSGLCVDWNSPYSTTFGGPPFCGPSSPPTEWLVGIDVGHNCSIVFSHIPHSPNHPPHIKLDFLLIQESFLYPLCSHFPYQAWFLRSRLLRFSPFPFVKRAIFSSQRFSFYYPTFFFYGENSIELTAPTEVSFYRPFFLDWSSPKPVRPVNDYPHFPCF